MKLTQKDKQLLASKGYEYLDAQYCYAKPGKNISIMQSQKKDFYIHFTTSPYKRGDHFPATSGVTILYFKTLTEVFKLIDVLDKYKIQ